MKRFSFLISLFAAAITTMAAGKPNVLIFFADDVGWGDIRCYNPDQAATMKTPTVDKLAQNGLRFTDAHSRSLCAPSRYSIMTGNYPFRTKQLGWSISTVSSVQPGQKTMGQMFQEIGYNTAFIGKWHMGGQLHAKDGSIIPSNFKKEWKNVDWSKPMHRGPTSLGFNYSFLTHSGVQAGPYFYLENDRMVGNPERIMQWTPGFHDNLDHPYQTEIEAKDFGLPEWDSTKVGEHYTQKALAFIDRHVEDRNDQPFFMFFSSQCIHTPMTPGTFLNRKVAGETGHIHTDMLFEMDLQLEALVSRLEKHNLLENTIILFTSDNGPWEELSPENYDSSAQWRGYKGQGYEAGHRIPFIIRWDGKIKPGTVCDQPIDQVDLLPSFATLLGGNLEADDALDGLDISPHFLDRQSTPLRNFIYAKGRIQKDSLIDFAFAEYSYRSEGYKILVSNQKRKPGEVMEMYRIKDDPEEKNNLVNHPEHAAMKARLLKQLKALHAGKRSTPTFENTTSDSE